MSMDSGLCQCSSLAASTHRQHDLERATEHAAESLRGEVGRKKHTFGGECTHLLGKLKPPSQCPHPSPHTEAGVLGK